VLLPIVLRSWLQRATSGSVLIVISIATPASSQSTGIDPDQQKTAPPIKHVIVLIGENRTFDHVFATYVPPGRDSVQNLLSEGIIDAKGSPGWNFSKAAQFQAVPPFKTQYFISLDRNEKCDTGPCPSRP
jgi:phospholipase C